MEQRQLGVVCPEIIDAEQLLEQFTEPDFYKRADNLLHYLRMNSEKIGAYIGLASSTHPTILRVESDDPRMANEIANNRKLLAKTYKVLAFTGSTEISEIYALAEYCSKQNWITFEKGDLYRYNLILNPQGYARLQELEGSNVQSQQAFVAMWFDSTLNEAYAQGIKPAIEQAGYKPIRIDRVDHLNKIDDQIIAEIRRSRFVVADFTQGEDGARGGVYYEAGFAHGLNIPVIFTCKKEAIDKVHFDTRQYNHILWEKPEQLRNDLTQRISATIGDGTLKK